MQSFAKCIQILFEHLQPLCCPISARNSNVFELLVFQMSSRTVHQVVRLTRGIDVPGHTAMLVRVMTETGYRWYPEYTVEEQFRDFNQSQFICTVRICTGLMGLVSPWRCPCRTLAYSMISIIQAGYASLNDTEFRYLPVARASPEGYYTGFYADAAHEEPLLRTTTEMLEERDRENRAWSCTTPARTTGLP